jgi:hypothetical protein
VIGRTIVLLAALLLLASVAAPGAAGSGKGRRGSDDSRGSRGSSDDAVDGVKRRGDGSPDDGSSGGGRNRSADDGVFVPGRGVLRVLAETTGGRSVVEVRLSFDSALSGEQLADEILRRFALPEQEAAGHLVVAGSTRLEDSGRLRIRVDRGRCEVELRFRPGTDDRRGIARAIAERTLLRREEVLKAVRDGEFRSDDGAWSGGAADDTAGGVKRRGDGSVDDSPPAR